MDRKNREKKRTNARVMKNEEKDMYDSIHRNGLKSKLDMDRIEKRVSFTTDTSDGMVENGHIQLSNLGETENVTQVSFDCILSYLSVQYISKQNATIYS
jgi:hypothetical protein